MIQYRLPNPGCSPAAAASCEDAALADLRRFGPWSVQLEETHLVFTQVVTGWTAQGWGAWQDSIVPGRTFRLATNLPGLHLLRRARLAELPWKSVELACGEAIRIPAALADGFSFGFDGQCRRPASKYARVLVELLDRQQGGEKPSPSEWLALIRLGIQAGHRLTDDAIHARDLVAHTDVAAYLEAMSHVPKAEPAAGA